MAANRMSARRDIADRSLDFECATVTVALSAMRSWASGVPTMVERPITSVSKPASDPVHGPRRHNAGLRRTRRQCRQADRDAADIEG
jgi:hypothetical protein